jgi:hypothetical protein
LAAVVFIIWIMGSAFLSQIPVFRRLYLPTHSNWVRSPQPKSEIAKKIVRRLEICKRTGDLQKVASSRRIKNPPGGPALGSK